MKRTAIQRLTLCVIAFLSIGIITSAQAASDPRFFGTYCGNHSESHTVRVWCCFGGHWFVVAERRYTLNYSVNAHAYYSESARGNGLVSGKGTASGEGQTIPFVFSGIVTGRGLLQGSGIAPGWEPTSATANLSADGNGLTLHALDRVLVLRKDLCGNEAPTATILSPEARTFVWGQFITFSGRALDREDAAVFPQERLVWTSSRDGKLGTGLSVFKSNLSPGPHTITFSVTDSGGLTASETISITINNNQPNLPIIIEPIYGATFYEGQEIAFRARATDREDGYLSGDSLVWSSSLVRGPSYPPVTLVLGTGDLLLRPLTEGEHTITLRATDRTGVSNSNSVRINVRPRPAGNTPPTVTITSPPNYYAMGDNTCITLIARASDLEDGPLRGGSLVWRDRYHDGRRARVRDIGTGERIDLCNPPAPGGDTRHELSVTARDSGGSSATNTIIIISIPGGLI